MGDMGIGAGSHMAETEIRELRDRLAATEASLAEMTTMVGRLTEELNDVNERFGDYAYHKGYLGPVDAAALKAEKNMLVESLFNIQVKLENAQKECMAAVEREKNLALAIRAFVRDIVLVNTHVNHQALCDLNKVLLPWVKKDGYCACTEEWNGGMTGPPANFQHAKGCKWGPKEKS